MATATFRATGDRYIGLLKLIVMRDRVGMRQWKELLAIGFAFLLSLGTGFGVNVGCNKDTASFGERSGENAAGEAIPQEVLKSENDDELLEETSQTVATKPPITISAVGDINFGMDMLPILDAHGYAYPWAYVLELLRSTDMAFANLECTISNRGSPVAGKTFTMRGRPEALPFMRSAGIDVVSQANNHARDYGAIALLDSLAYLDQNGIAHCGAGADYTRAHEPAFLSAKGVRVAFLAYDDIGYSGWYAGLDYPGVANADDTGQLAMDIHSAKKQADLVVVSFHWGIERQYAPDATQRNLAHLAIESGADLVIGHHPHVVQGFEIYRGRLICYSLGNFIFSPGSEAGRYTILVQLTLGVQGFLSASVYPYYISGGRPTPMSGDAAISWLNKVAEISRSLGTSMTITGNTARIP
jgi:poly-gamma-glutamate synthesis protein (capsule biosynthesis protein)